MANSMANTAGLSESLTCLSLLTSYITGYDNKHVLVDMVVHVNPRITLLKGFNLWLISE